MIKKEINITVVLPVHHHGETRLLYLPKKYDVFIPKKAKLLQVRLQKVVG